MKKVMLNIDAEVLATIRQIAKDQGISLDDFINAILKDIWCKHVSNKLKQYTK